MRLNNEQLAPTVRGPVNAEKKAPGDPADPPLTESVRQLSSDVPLERIQADNRLKQAGARGVLAAADFVHDTSARAEQLAEAVRFLGSADFAILDADQAASVREALATALGSSHAHVRLPAAQALRVHGPGSQRTVFLTAIIDPERRVRWEVVQRFSDHPDEVDKSQRAILFGYLEGGEKADFDSVDKDSNGQLSRAEFTGSEGEFARMDHDQSGAVDADEWASPVASDARADITALLLRLHTKLTPGEKPPLYNPWLPSAGQMDMVRRWRQWSDQLS